MARQNGVWVEYSTEYNDAQQTERKIERVFPSELKSLRIAVGNGNDVVFVEFGETIDEALERVARKPATKRNDSAGEKAPA